jgi:hypothetical protein
MTCGVALADCERSVGSELNLMLSLLTSASPARRGLAPGPEKGIYYFGPDYGDRIGSIARELAR